MARKLRQTRKKSCEEFSAMNKQRKEVRKITQFSIFLPLLPRTDVLIWASDFDLVCFDGVFFRPTSVRIFLSLFSSVVLFSVQASKQSPMERSMHRDTGCQMVARFNSCLNPGVFQANAIASCIRKIDSGRCLHAYTHGTSRSADFDPFAIISFGVASPRTV